MKKILALVIVLLCLTSCGGHRKADIDVVAEFEYNGHQYIMFEDFGKVPRDDISGFVHSPDCPCMKEVDDDRLR